MTREEMLEELVYKAMCTLCWARYGELIDACLYCDNSFSREEIGRAVVVGLEHLVGMAGGRIVTEEADDVKRMLVATLKVQAYIKQKAWIKAEIMARMLVDMIVEQEKGA